MRCLSVIFSSVLLVSAGALMYLWYGRLTDRVSRDTQTTDALQAAQAAFGQGDLSTAILHARQHLTASPDDVNALYILARALIYRSYSEYNLSADRESAVGYTNAVYLRNPLNRDVQAIHAMALQANGQPGAAAEIAQKALEVEAPSSAIARTALALAYNSVGSYDTALREAERAVAAAASPPALVDALRALALSYRDVGRYNDAMSTLNRAIAIDDRLLALYFERAQFALLLGDSDTATVSYFSILTRDDNNVKARLRLCELSSVMRERDRAVEYCQAVTIRAPSWYEGWYRLGMEYFLQGDFEQAQRNLHRCATLQTLQDVTVNSLRFECWYIQGQAAEIRGDCPNLVAIYNEWRTIAADHEVRQRWTYPPEGPPACA